ncbi:hypothetical protein ACLB1R_09950 [Escherichia coli]
MQHLILPALTLAFVHLGIVARQIRSAMLEQFSEHGIPHARASGLPGPVYRWMLCATQCVDPFDYRIGAGAGRFVVWRSADPNRFLPCWNGMGSDINTGARLPGVMGFAVVVSFAYVLVNLVVDSLYPRILSRIGRGGGE